LTEMKVGKIFDDAFISISKKLISLDLRRKKEEIISVKCMEFVKTKGKFNSTIICGFSSDIFDAIIIGMNDGKMPSEDEKVLYINEYVNIICGRALSEINNRLGRTSRLTVPMMCSDKESIDIDDSEMENEVLFYETEFGNIEVCIYYKII
jgi:CheY-specific phosphatase CheX